ncbi:glycoside hydrolase [Mycena rebaudengoi]|nr:glycoside hydrolase [Mycena rebaudengoi]
MRPTVFSLFAFTAFTRAYVIPFKRSTPVDVHLRQTADAPKLVVAHHMVGNTFPYTLQDWTDDITLAHAASIDGFALNLGPEEFQTTQAANAFQAAQQFGPDFKLFLSLDMSVLPCGTVEGGASLRALVQKFATQPNALQVEGRAFVSTFAGESCTFGQASVPEGWRSQFTQHPDLQGKIHFVPAFFMDPATFKDFTGVMDGDFNFNAGWPVQLTTDFAKALPEIAGDLAASEATDALGRFIGSIDTDNQHIAALEPLGGASTTYMSAVSPWFFTHFGVDTFNKNFMFLADQHLYPKRWEALVAARDQIDIVEIATWNDYGESHYIGPIKGALPPTSDVWVNGFPHEAWLDLTRYYATAFKTGQFPAVEKDQIFMWSRPHSTNAQAADPVGPPKNFELTTDAVWAVVLATAPATVTLSTSDATTQTFDVIPGVNKLSIPIAPGNSMSGTIQRDGQTVVELKPEFTFQANPTTFNFNVFVASASA